MLILLYIKHPNYTIHPTHTEYHVAPASQHGYTDIKIIHPTHTGQREHLLQFLQSMRDHNPEAAKSKQS